MVFALPEGLHERDRPVRVGVVGAGQFGTRCIHQVERTPGLVTSAAADPTLANAETALAEAGVPERERSVVEETDEADAVLADGKRAVLADGDALAAADVDVVLESTGRPNAGARHAHTALSAGTHVVMATVEADATVGPALADLARSRGVVYSAAYGDQPALVAELVAWARTTGLEVVAAGRGISSYDANAAIELCAAANLTGLPPDPSGLHAPTTPFAEVPETLRHVEDGGTLTETGVVDGTVSPDGENRVPGESVADGVFVVVTTPTESTRAFLATKNRSGAYVSADGTHLAFFRPHHLPGAETPVSIARAAVRNDHTGTPRDHVADVTAIADDTLGVGTEITVTYPKTDAALSAALESAARAVEGRHVPFALLDGATVVRAVEVGEPITYDDVDLPPSFLGRLRGVASADNDHTDHQ